MRIFFSIAIIVFMMTLDSGRAMAQYIPQPVSLSASPASPSRGETVRVEAAASIFDRSTSLFDWTVDGRKRSDLSGFGKHTITFTAKEVGFSHRVSVVVTAADGKRGNASLAIPVSDLALGWFAETYIPKWYKGKALPTQGSIIDVVAIPRIIIGGVAIRPDRLVYTWSVDDQERVRSGVGEQAFRVKTSSYIPSTYHVRVVVEDLEKRVRKEGEIFLEDRTPRLGIYPFLPLGGIEPRQGGTTRQTTRRGIFDFIAEPFFFPIASRQDLSFTWRVDQAATQGAPGNPHLLTIDTENQPSRAVAVSATAGTESKFLPRASRFLTFLLE